MGVVLLTLINTYVVKKTFLHMTKQSFYQGHVVICLEGIERAEGGSSKPKLSLQAWSIYVNFEMTGSSFLWSKPRVHCSSVIKITEHGDLIFWPHISDFMHCLCTKCSVNSKVPILTLILALVLFSHPIIKTCQLEENYFITGTWRL